MLIPLGNDISREVRKGPDGKEVQVRVDRAGGDASALYVDYVNETTPKYLAALRGVTQDVKAGKYQNRQEAERAMFVAQRNFLKAHPPPRKN